MPPSSDLVAELTSRISLLESRQSSAVAEASGSVSNAITGFPRETPLPRTDVDDPNSATESRGLIYRVTSHGDTEYQGDTGDRTLIHALSEKLTSWPNALTPTEKLASATPTATLFARKCETFSGELPPKELASQLVTAALDVHRYLPIVHQPTFFSSFDLVYGLDKGDYGAEEMRFVALLYAVLAYGCLHIEPQVMNDWSWDDAVSRA